MVGKGRGTRNLKRSMLKISAIDGGFEGSIPAFAGVQTAFLGRLAKAARVFRRGNAAKLGAREPSAGLRSRPTRDGHGSVKMLRGLLCCLAVPALVLGIHHARAAAGTEPDVIVLGMVT